MESQLLLLQDFNYDLPDDKIAKFPLSSRVNAKLLVFNNQIIDTTFNQLHNFIPNNSTLLLNNTKVIPARLLFQKSSGAVIQIFLLQVIDPNTNVWKCIIGNKSKFKVNDNIKAISDSSLIASWFNHSLNLIQFTHSINVNNAIESIGQVPLPPYINRKANAKDKIRYQSVFANIAGAVAAPTASLHFSQKYLKELYNIGIKSSYCTLHVSQGTFNPIKTNLIQNHTIHSEVYYFSISQLISLSNQSFIIPVGTTALRTLESLPLIAHKILIKDPNPFEIIQQDAFLYNNVKPNKELTIQIIINFANKNKLQTISGNSALFITPNFKFIFLNALITNFHQPQSSLLVLISAILGPNWKNIYNHALKNNYRFLSYGDSSLLFYQQS